ncbi:hypothetical protein QBC46DRAFT_412121 [Diplogelasinospora grovesii]|uniref:Uncharacterized protein n=1 Tax=Diplogelasinospora grovesii TaxID=303347 RepID=A0AAN6MZV4_9PEZI|nr:hypothetical protein QBC46DRAFT_412121 [Diplogelasinospora grovesii]
MFVTRKAACLTIGGDPENPNAYSHGLNLVAFMARLSHSVPTLVTFCIWMMRHVFEAKYVVHEEKGLGDDWEGFNFHVSMAVLWVLFAGLTLCSHLVKAPLIFERKYGRFVTASRYHGPESGLERWRFWEDEMRAAAKRVGIAAGSSPVRMRR